MMTTITIIANTMFPQIQQAGSYLGTVQWQLKYQDTHSAAHMLGLTMHGFSMDAFLLFNMSTKPQAQDGLVDCKMRKL